MMGIKRNSWQDKMCYNLFKNISLRPSSVTTHWNHLYETFQFSGHTFDLYNKRRNFHKRGWSHFLNMSYEESNITVTHAFSVLSVLWFSMESVISKGRQPIHISSLPCTREGSWWVVSLWSYRSNFDQNFEYVLFRINDTVRYFVIVQHKINLHASKTTLVSRFIPCFNSIILKWIWLEKKWVGYIANFCRLFQMSLAVWNAYLIIKCCCFLHLSFHFHWYEIWENQLSCFCC